MTFQVSHEMLLHGRIAASRVHRALILAPRKVGRPDPRSPLTLEESKPEYPPPMAARHQTGQHRDKGGSSPPPRFRTSLSLPPLLLSLLLTALPQESPAAVRWQGPARPFFLLDLAPGWGGTPGETPSPTLSLSLAGGVRNLFPGGAGTVRGGVSGTVWGGDFALGGNFAGGWEWTTGQTVWGLEVEGLFAASPEGRALGTVGIRAHLGGKVGGGVLAVAPSLRGGAGILVDSEGTTTVPLLVFDVALRIALPWPTPLP